MYMVRSKSIGGYRPEVRFEKFLERGVVAIGWSALGDLNRFESLEEIIKKLLRTKKPKSARPQAENLFRFSRELRVGNYVITDDPNKKLYAVGEIVGNYTYNPEFFDFKEDNFPNIIPVKWIIRFSRWDLSDSVRVALDYRRAVFQLKDEAAVKKILGLVRDGWK